MSDVFSRLRTVAALGFRNAAKVALYRFGLRTRLHRACRITASVPRPPFFHSPVALRQGMRAPIRWRNDGLYFGRHLFPVGQQPPDWFINPFNGVRISGAERGWWNIPDFVNGSGDIKAVWEASRGDWILAYAQQAAVGDQLMLDRLNIWLADWCERNPPYCGPNWKCGQEASIRVIHLALAAIILSQDRDPDSGIRQFVAAHCRRIAATLGYAIAQDNNHGTSEAVALFIGGTWLAGEGGKEEGEWARLGRFWLEDRVLRLFEEDGSFSQYSVNYHRLALDAVCMAEVWRRRRQAPMFSPAMLRRIVAATGWLHAMVDQRTGDAPNLGGNDGANLLPLSDVDNRDHRPTVQLSSALFLDRCAYPGDGAWSEALAWMGVEMPQLNTASLRSEVFNHGGYAILRRGQSMSVLRYPRFRFRPSHADCLHVDLWHEGVNLLRDAGSFSYNPDDSRWSRYFTGTAAHNTVQFDDRDQMSRVSRFLFGDWLQVGGIEAMVEESDAVSFGASYQDRHGAMHQRHLVLTDAHLMIRDRLPRVHGKAVLRWRLAPGPWRLEGHRLTNGAHVLSIEATMPIFRVDLISGWESRYYFEKSESPILEIEVRESGEIVSDYRWSA
jgi:hypothetical protein